MTNNPIVKIEKVIYGGDGLGHIDGKTVFVPFTAPGDEVKIKITEEKKNYSRGEIVEIISSASCGRIPFCQYFGTCGGCQLQHINYDDQVTIKTGFVQDAYRNLVFSKDKIQSCQASPRKDFYRNKITLYIDKVNHLIGYHKKNSHQLIDIKNCRIAYTTINGALKLIRDNFSPEDFNLIDSIVLRANDLNELMIIFTGTVSYKSELPEKIYKLEHGLSIKSIICAEENGHSFIITKNIDDNFLLNQTPIKHKISPPSFSQINLAVASNLLATLKNALALTGQETLIDAYCGSGLISLFLADKVKRVIGLESVPEAVEDAKANAELLNYSNCRFICGSVEQELIKLKESADILIIDPPRAGCDPKTIEAILQLQPQKLAYISCDPSTMARDMAKLSQIYQISFIQPFDMFPQTGHVETLALLTK